MAAGEAWFLGGPVDGRLMPVEVAADGSPSAVVKLSQTGVYVGAARPASDLPLARLAVSGSTAVVS